VKLAEARALAREIQAIGPACTVPYGHGPDNYFARIWSARGCVTGTHPVDFIKLPHAYRRGISRALRPGWYEQHSHGP